MTQKYRHILHVIALHFGVDFGYDTIKHKKVHGKSPVNHKQIVVHYCHLSGVEKRILSCNRQNKVGRGATGWCRRYSSRKYQKGVLVSRNFSLCVDFKWKASLLVCIMSPAAAIGGILLPRFLKLQTWAKLYQQISRLIKTLHFQWLTLE